MQINITGQHIEVTAALRSFVEGKLERLEKHFNNVTNVHVILSAEKEMKKAEATVRASGANIFADAKHDDMYSAIDTLVYKLDRQIKKHKEKLTNHRR